MSQRLSKELFTNILSRHGSRAEIEHLRVERFREIPGVHWSNPGLKRVVVCCDGKERQFVVKTLHEKSKREVLIYRFLSGLEDFPIPRLFHSVYDDEREAYWIVLECCEPNGESPFQKREEWERVGLLLARTHGRYWNKTDRLPELFTFTHRKHSLGSVRKNMVSFLERLCGHDRKVLQSEIYPDLDGLARVVAAVDDDYLSEEVSAGCCLVHGAFHAPEIVTRRTPEGRVPLGVDWECARIGRPEEDLALAGAARILSQRGRGHCEAVLRAYISEMRNMGAEVHTSQLVKAMLPESLHKMMRNVPWLTGVYLARRNDETFRLWCDWFRRSMPKTLRALHEHFRGVN